MNVFKGVGPAAADRDRPATSFNSIRTIDNNAKYIIINKRQYKKTIEVLNLELNPLTCLRFFKLSIVTIGEY